MDGRQQSRDTLVGNLMIVFKIQGMCEILHLHEKLTRCKGPQM